MITAQLMNRRRFAAMLALPLAGSVLTVGRAGAQATPAASPLASPGATPVVIPNSPVGKQLTWVLSIINDKRGVVSAAEITAHMAPAVLTQVPAAQFQQVFKQLAAAYAPMTVVQFVTPPTQTDMTTLIKARGGAEFYAKIAVDGATPNLIEELLFQPASQKPATPVAVSSWSELDQQLTAVAPQVNLVVAEVAKGKLNPIHGMNQAKPMPLGSAFKLYVLGDLAHQVDQGKVHWDDELAIRDDWKSLPSGDMRNEPAGKTFTLEYFAEQMISVSDNTAADHLLFHLGRENVEGFQGQLGNTNASLNVPFMATREMFVLKLAMSADQVAMYLAAGRDERRQILNTQVAKTPVTLAEAAGWTKPRYIDKIEWFASPEDIGRTLVSLQEMWAKKGLEPVKKILSINPGVHFDPKVWPFIGFKGGSELGVMTLNWILQRHDQRWFVVSVGYSNTKDAIDEQAGILAATSAVNFLTGA